MLTDVVARRASDGRAAKSVRATGIWPGQFAIDAPAGRGMPGMRSASCVVSSGTHVVGQLRVATVAQLRRWGVGRDGGPVELLELAVSELATNAIRHGPAGRGARVAVTWGVYRGGPGPDRVSVSVWDGGRGGLRIREARSDDELSEGQYGLPLLLQCGLRIEPALLPAHGGRGGGHLVTAWTPVRARSRARVCPCPCWEHGYQHGRCQGLISGTRHDVALFGGPPLACCAPCAHALTLLRLGEVSLLSDSAPRRETSSSRPAPAMRGGAGRQ